MVVVGSSFIKLGRKGMDLISAKLNEIDSTVEQTSHASPEISCPCCGSRISSDVKFCPECGASTKQCSLAACEDSNPPLQEVDRRDDTDQVVRQSSFAGLVQKCPNCGAPIDATDAICNECGFKISGRKANSVVARFSDQLIAIEQERRESGLLSGAVESLINAGGVSRADKQIITLINTFPIPNNIEEISEFMFMACSNIDVKLSRKTLFPKNGKTAEAAISDVWVSKMKQIYNKAKMAFPDDERFAHIESLYVEKMNELKMDA
ncbi:zinc ribbon domain-containing protein [Adlercreutzia murintestinalis]|uniref:zinc ribbon domain-containing protein n=1 Tax=Adlercreutzia murintestinalis TaxID=2941325 RepID=UPI00203D0CB3|nr:zinc ribbon domain-containing protein [Adlercreutzia murintestinalis]